MVSHSVWLPELWDLVTAVLPLEGNRHPAIGLQVPHFFLRGFFESDFDSLLWHIFTIEAALGAGGDRRNKNFGIQEILSRRISALTGSDDDAEFFKKEAYDLRSQFVHGDIEVGKKKKKKKAPIFDEDLRRVRGLTRDVLEAFLIFCRNHPDADRVTILNQLFDPEEALTAVNSSAGAKSKND